MVTFLFWNIHKKPIIELIVTLAHSYKVDVLILAESIIPKDIVGKALNAGQRQLYLPDTGISKKLQIFTRFLHRSVTPMRDSGGIAIRHIEPPIGKSILLVAVHLPSKLYQTEDDQKYECVRLANLISIEEGKVGHNRTIILGDLNMNPFEHGIISSDGLHALSDSRIVQHGFRRVRNEEKMFFYNPMWNHFGDKSPTPPGTYFFDTGTYINFYWHMFDQILLRPGLLYAFQNENLQIITEINGISLLNGFGRPNQVIASDHLPVFLKLNL